MVNIRMKMKKRLMIQRIVFGIFNFTSIVTLNEFPAAYRTERGYKGMENK
jgi:hypothetical protein